MKRSDVWEDYLRMWGDEDDRWVRVPRTPPAITDLDYPLPYPHYTDRRWQTAQLIWGRECKVTMCNYSDRLWQWDYTAAQQASKTCRDAGLRPDTARWTEAWLTRYHGRPVVLRYIMAGCNAATGYAYYVYGYDYASKERGCDEAVNTEC